MGSLCGLGHALSMKALQGGKATNDTIDVHIIAVLLRGLGYASAGLCLSGREVRGPRPRGADTGPGRHTRRTPGPCPKDQPPVYLSRPSAKYGIQTLNSEGRWIAAGSSPSTLNYVCDVERTVVNTTTHHDAHTLSLRHTVPGIGPDPRPRAALRHPSDRPLPAGAESVHPLVAWASTPRHRLETLWNLRHHHRQCASHVGFLRSGPLMPPRSSSQGKNAWRDWRKKHSKGKALTILAHTLARAVYYLLKQKTAFDMATFLYGSGRGVSELRVILILAW